MVFFFVGTTYSLSLWAFRDPFSGKTCLIGVPSPSLGLFMPDLAHVGPILAPVHTRLPVLRTSGVRLWGRSSELVGSSWLARMRQLVGLFNRDAVAIAQPQGAHRKGQ